MNAKRLRIDSRQPESQTLQQAAAVLARGGLVVFPTRCIYGLGADAFDRTAVSRIFAVKGRPGAKPLLVLISERSAAAALVKEIPPSAERLMERFWPGRVTLVLEAAADVIPELTGGSGKIGIRLPGHPVASALVRVFGRAVTGTSANLSGQGGCSRIAELDPRLRRQVDLVLDAGVLAGGIGSTVVDLTESPPIVLREGVVPAGRIYAAIDA